MGKRSESRLRGKPRAICNRVPVACPMLSGVDQSLRFDAQCGYRSMIWAALLLIAGAVRSRAEAAKACGTLSGTARCDPRIALQAPARGYER